MVQIEEHNQQEEDEDDINNHQHQHQHPQHQQPSSSNMPLPTSLKQENSTPSSPSSISSDHTFHGFSLPPSPSPTSNALVPLSPALTPAPVPLVSASRLVRDPPPDPLTKTESHAETAFATPNTPPHMPRPDSKFTRHPGLGVGPGSGQARRGKLAKRVGLALRFTELLVCLVSFSVMAADKRRGWALDSFDRYIEFRYSMTVNVIGFAYSALQALDLLYQLIAGKGLVRSQLRYCFDFALDQILAYLLLSSSSSAFTRVDDWISNWGKDKFPAMASASVGVSFLAFIAFALSSLISGYVLCTQRT